MFSKLRKTIKEVVKRNTEYDKERMKQATKAYDDHIENLYKKGLNPSDHPDAFDFAADTFDNFF